MDGPGRLLGYRALHKKLREVHGLMVPRNMIYMMMEEVDPSGLEERGWVGQSERPARKKRFTSMVKANPIITNNCVFSCANNTLYLLFRAATVPCH